MVDEDVGLLALESLGAVDPSPGDGDRVHAGRLCGADVEGGVADVRGVLRRGVEPRQRLEDGVWIGLVALRVLRADDDLEVRLEARAAGRTPAAPSRGASRVTMPSRRPSARSRGSTSTTSQNASSSSWSRLVVRAVRRHEVVHARRDRGRASGRRGPGPPTAAASTSSGTSRPSTVFAACFIDARIIGPESMSVPSRSKRTTGKRTA